MAIDINKQKKQNNYFSQRNFENFDSQFSKQKRYVTLRSLRYVRYTRELKAKDLVICLTLKIKLSVTLDI